MNQTINPDIEPLQIPPLTVDEQFGQFEHAVSQYVLTRAALRDVSLEVSKLPAPPPEDVRDRLRIAAQEDEAAKRTIVALSLILMASGALDRARDALSIEIAGRL